MLRAVLIGAPGSGKSTVGKALSRELSTNFADTDELIVEREGKSIPQIFNEHGEPGFRKIEAEVVIRALSAEYGVLSLGGGSILHPEVREAISKANTEVIFLRIGLGNVIPRISGKSDRPLVADNPEAQWTKIFKEREPLYKSLATIEVSTDNKKPSEVARELVERMGLPHA
jgi:shikimate kinase